MVTCDTETEATRQPGNSGLSLDRWWTSVKSYFCRGKPTSRQLRRNGSPQDSFEEKLDPPNNSGRIVDVLLPEAASCATVINFSHFSSYLTVDRYEVGR